MTNNPALAQHIARIVDRAKDKLGWCHVEGRSFAGGSVYPMAWCTDERSSGKVVADPVPPAELESDDEDSERKHIPLAHMQHWRDIHKRQDGRWQCTCIRCGSVVVFASAGWMARHHQKRSCNSAIFKKAKARYA